jgi:hypothetical protein
MTIKELAHSAQQHLQARTGSSFKRAHIYELLAGSFGFNSYAALSSEAVFTRRQPDTDHPSRHSSAIRQRCVELGYDPATADVVSSEFPALIAERQIDVIRFSDLVAQLRGGSSFPHEHSEWKEGGDQADDGSEEMLAPTWFGPEGESFPPILLDGLEAAASRGNPLAHYALALIHAPNEDEDDQAVGSSYWHSQALQGRVLTGIEKEWADAHARQLADANKYVFHLREAARLGSDHALLDLADRFDDPSFFMVPHGAAHHDPVNVAEIAERLGRIGDARHWLAIAAEAGDTDAMHRLIEEFDHENLQQCWTWLYLAQLAGTDLTQSKQYAINEDGSPYDDDVGGAAYVAGQDGVELTALDAEQNAAARHAAEELFKRIQLAA